MHQQLITGLLIRHELISNSIGAALPASWSRMKCLAQAHRCASMRPHLYDERGVRLIVPICGGNRLLSMTCTFSLAQVEPFDRALKTLEVDCMINGRRRDHGAERAYLEVIGTPPA